MKRITTLVLIAIFAFSATAYASAIPQISEELFILSKQTLTCLSTGAYDCIVEILPFSEPSPSAPDWRSFAETSFAALIGSTVQTDYAVAYWDGLFWNFAVPVFEPIEDTIETLILTSPDGVTFSGYSASTWAEVKGQYLFASYVVWDKEYIESAPIIAID